MVRSFHRCKVHFMSNIQANVGYRYKAEFATKLKLIWVQSNRESALRSAKQLIDDYQQFFPQAIQVLDDRLQDPLQFYAIDTFDPRKIASTDLLDRINSEIRWRSRVVGIFPSEDSDLRLITCHLIEYSEDWANSMSEIKKTTIEGLRTRLKTVA